MSPATIDREPRFARRGPHRFVSSRVGIGIVLLIAAAAVGWAQAPSEPKPTELPSFDASPPGDQETVEAVAGRPVGGGLGLVPGASLVPVNNSPQIQLGAAGNMIGFSNSDGAGTQTITLIDTRKSWMAVYHVGRSGKIRLVSSRPLDADFSLQLNATSPLPEEIRALSGR